MRVAIRMGVPTSAVTVSAISDARLASASCRRRRYSARCLPDVAAHAGNACRAARTAASTSAAEAAGTVAITSWVAGFSTSMTEVVCGRTQSPARKISFLSRFI